MAAVLALELFFFEASVAPSAVADALASVPDVAYTVCVVPELVTTWASWIDDVDVSLSLLEVLVLEAE